MKQGTTVTLAFDLKINADDVTKIIFTFKENVKDQNYLLQKTYPDDGRYEDNKVKIPLTQKDTLQLTKNFIIEAQLIFANKSTTKSVNRRYTMQDTLWTTDVDDSESDGNEVIIDLKFDESVEGTSNYEKLINIPKINDIELRGNKTANDLGLAADEDLEETNRNVEQLDNNKADKNDTFGKEDIKNLLNNGYYFVDDYKVNGTYPTKDKKLFAGWYVDDSLDTPYLFDTGIAYAHFIDENVLIPQVNFGGENNNVGTVRFVATIDEKYTDYVKVGFILCGYYGSNFITNKERNITTIYNSIVGWELTDFSQESNKFFAYNINGIDKTKTNYWFARGIVETADGTKVISPQSVVYTFKDGEFVKVQENNMLLLNEIVERLLGDTDTLTAAKNYTDEKTDGLYKVEIVDDYPQAAVDRKIYYLPKRYNHTLNTELIGRDTNWAAKDNNWFVYTGSQSAIQFGQDTEDTDYLAVINQETPWWDQWNIQLKKRIEGLDPNKTYKIVAPISSQSNDGKIQITGMDNYIKLNGDKQTLISTIQGSRTIEICYGFGYVGLNNKILIAPPLIYDEDGKLAYPHNKEEVYDKYIYLSEKDGYEKI